MKKSLRRELFREIRKSLNRYLSILFIVLLGVAFFTGVRASEPDMRLSMDRMADESSFMDFRILSSYGLTEGDLEAIRAVPGVSRVEGEYALDVLERSGERQTVLHLMSMTEELNRLTLVEGRMPKKAGECLIDAQLPVVSDLQIGSVLQFESGTEDPLSDSLKRKEFTVVGSCTIPYHLDFERGSSAIGNGEVTGFVLTPPSEFCMEVYTQAYAVSEDLRPLLYTSAAYETRAEEIRAAIEGITGERIDLRMEELTGDARRELEDAREEYEKAREEADGKFAEAEEKLADAEEKLESGRSELEENRRKLEEAKKTIEENEAALLEAKNSLAQEEAEIGALSASISAREQSYSARRNAWAAAKTAYEAKKRELRAKELEIRITESLPESDARNEAISALQEELAVLSRELSEAETVLSWNPQPASGEQMQIFTDKIALNVRESQLASTRTQVADGEAQLLSGKEEYEKGLAAFSEAEETLAEKEKEYEDGRADYEKEKADAEKELDEALTKIEDGEAELDAVAEPEWFILGRDTVPSYVSLDSDAGRIGALGKVFPVIFFLVAALVSLTTMTRMVEEKRTEIGTMLSLGYSTSAIAWKYVAYALSATLAGSAAGILLGEKILPWVIIHTYQIMYTNLQVIAVPYRWGLGVLASLAAAFCTVGASLFSCLSSIRKTPAVLMRPAAPKQGRKIFLERVPLIWKHLKFSQKSTLRNLFRYKKRLFMTVFGIGACMALLIVGFGLHDSIFVVIDKQFGDLWKYDGTAALSPDADETEREALYTEMEGMSEITEVLPAMAKQIDATAGKTTKTANLIIPEDPEIFMRLFSLRDRHTGEPRVLTSEGVLITEKLSKQLAVEPGGSIRLKEDEFTSRTVTVAGIVENYVYQYIYMTPEYYAGTFGKDAENSVVYFKLSEESAIDAVSERLLGSDSVQGVSRMGSSKDTIRDMLQSLNLVIMVLIVSAGLLAFVVLYNLNNINITERIRELATLRVLGYYDGELALYVYRENFILTLFGILAGVFMGKWLHSFTITTVEVDVIMFGRVVHPISYLWCILLTLGFAFIVNFIMFFRLRRIDMVESLKSVE